LIGHKICIFIVFEFQLNSRIDLEFEYRMRVYTKSDQQKVTWKADVMLLNSKLFMYTAYVCKYEKIRVECRVKAL